MERVQCLATSLDRMNVQTKTRKAISTRHFDSERTQNAQGEQLQAATGTWRPADLRPSFVHEACHHPCLCKQLSISSIANSVERTRRHNICHSVSFFIILHWWAHRDGSTLDLIVSLRSWSETKRQILLCGWKPSQLWDSEFLCQKCLSRLLRCLQ